MRIHARVIADSITDGGSRLVTWELTYPRFIHAELMTHRVLSRNLASSRAIPAAKMRAMVEEHPVVPLHWGANQKGMQATREVEDTTAARDWWRRACEMACYFHEEGERLGLHKQLVNRLIEPWLYAVGVVTATDHSNLFHQRRHKDAEPHFQALAECMWDVFHENMPAYVGPAGWHLPYIDEVDSREVSKMTVEAGTDYDAYETMRAAISTARCARVSYLNHEGKRWIPDDLALYERLLGSDVMHASPFEHPAQAVGGRARIGNFEGWKQFRKFFPWEAGPDTSDRCERCGCWDGNHVSACPARAAAA